MTNPCTTFAATLLLVASASAQIEIVHYDFIGPIDENASFPTTVLPGFVASNLHPVGATPGTSAIMTDHTYYLDGWSNSATIDTNQYIEFGIAGNWPAGEIRHDWFLSSFGPLEVAVRSSVDGFTSDIATDSRPPGSDPATDFQASLDISSLGNLSGSTIFRLYFYGGSDGGNPDFNTLFIDGSGFGGGDIGLKVFDGTPGPSGELCSGDGGDQMGCTDCPCSNNAPFGSGGGCLNSAGTGSRLMVSGDTSVSLPMASVADLRFSATGGPANQLFILNSGNALAPGDPANPCFGLGSGVAGSAFDGLRCAIMGTLRNGGRGADSNGDVGVTNNPWGGEANPPGGIAQFFGYSSGTTKYFQCIHRDSVAVNCGTGLNTTQAIEVTFTP